MIKVLFLSTVLLLTLNARENPFFAAKGEQDIPYSSNENRTKKPLKRAAITLPSEARLLKKVTIEYQNLDGSIESKTIELQNSVDWHLPIFVSQNIASQNSASKNYVKKKTTKYKKIASIKEIQFYSSNRSLKIFTEDKIIRDFLLVNPHRLVVDFKKENSNMKSYTKKNSTNIFRQIKVGNHKGYYRVVIELDGLYRYTLNKIPNGYILKLR